MNLSRSCSRSAREASAGHRTLGAATRSFVAFLEMPDQDIEPKPELGELGAIDQRELIDHDRIDQVGHAVARGRDIAGPQDSRCAL